jgi:uncharacterized membrane protein YkoI
MFILFTTFVITSSKYAVAQGGFTAATNTIKANQQSNKQQLQVKSSNQAAQKAQRHFGGKVLKVKAQNNGYRVKLIKKNGYIITVFVDAKSGQISGR